MSSIKKRPDGQWRARYRDEAGKEHARHFDRKLDAKRWLDEVTASVVTGQYVDPRAGAMTFRTFAEDWRVRQMHRPRTAQTVKGILHLHVYPAIGSARLDSIGAAQIQRLVKQWQDEGASPDTIEGRFTQVSIVFRAAVAERRLIRSPASGIRLPAKRPKSALVPITTEVVAAMYEAMPEHLRTFVTVGAGSGMRRGELFGLTRDRVSDRFGTIQVDRQLAPGKGDEVAFAPPKTQASDRIIPVAGVVIDEIRRHEERFGLHPSGLVFTSSIGTPLRPSTLWTAWDRAATEVGTEATPHDLRHYFASVQIRGGCSIKGLQALLGHKSATETLDTYGHLMGDEDDRSRAVIDSAFGFLADSVRTDEAAEA